MSDSVSQQRLKHQQVQYLEFLSANLEAAKSFYSQALGWRFVDYGPHYTAFEGDFVDGGFTTGIPVKGSILVILYSENLTQTRNNILAAGGTISREIFDFPGGRRFHFLDPDGYELAVWSL